MNFSHTNFKPVPSSFSTLSFCSKMISSLPNSQDDFPKKKDSDESHEKYGALPHSSQQNASSRCCFPIVNNYKHTGILQPKCIKPIPLCQENSQTLFKHEFHNLHDYSHKDSQYNESSSSNTNTRRNSYPTLLPQLEVDIRLSSIHNTRRTASYNRQESVPESCQSYDSGSISPPPIPRLKIKKTFAKKPRKKYKTRKTACEPVEDISALPPQLTKSTLQRRKRVRHPKNPMGEPIRFCKICGDTAINFNYGIISCESCKAFFRRNAYRFKELFCVRSGDKISVQCSIDKQSRKNCSACRLVKCFDLGMRRDWEEVPGSKAPPFLSKSISLSDCHTELEKPEMEISDPETESSLSSEDTQRAVSQIKREKIDMDCEEPIQDPVLESNLVDVVKDKPPRAVLVLGSENRSSENEKYDDATRRFTERYYSVTNCPGPYVNYCRCSYSVTLLKSQGNEEFNIKASDTFMEDCHSLGLVYEQFFCNHRVSNSVKNVRLGNHDCVLIIVDTLLQKLIFYVKHLSEFESMSLEEKKSLLMSRFNLVLAILFRQIWNFKIRAGLLIAQDGTVCHLNPFEILPLQEGDLIYDEMQVMYEYQNLVESLNEALPVSSAITAILSLLKLFEPQSQSDEKFTKIFLHYGGMLRRYVQHLCPEDYNEKWKKFVRWYHYMVEVFDPASNNLLLKLSGLVISKPPLLEEVFLNDNDDTHND